MLSPVKKLRLSEQLEPAKTTITNLINRFYDIDDGKIQYDGININEICKKDLRRSLGIVLQDVNLFTGTIMENIRYGRLDATDEEVIEAAKRANAHDFIIRLPEGYNTVISGTGGELSQGQCQLISIARCAGSRSTGYDIGRSHQQHRYSYRKHRTKGHGQSYGRPNCICNCTPSFYCKKLSGHLSIRPRPNHRARQP